MGAYPELFDEVQVTTLYYPYEVKTAPNGVADLALTFRNAHNWVVPGYGGENAANTHFRALFDALKPGATLGVVDHRWPDPATEDPASGNGYVSEERLIALVTAAGFELVARSDMHRNPKDTHEHPYGVWSLPPDLALGDQDRAKYVGIGESDRMTLKFRKPVD
jgi:predicted methyltransferase